MVVAVLAVAVAATVVALTRTSAPSTGAPPGAGAGTTTTTTAAAAATTTTVDPTTTTVDPGSLPQTDAFPSTADPTFAARMDDLWAGVQAGATTPALPAFFPESAYVSLKAEGDPSADYTERLLGEYGEDLLAAHALLGADPAAATLVGVDVDQAYGHWVPPGTCANGIGYFEVPNARVVYSVAGQTRSFGIASMISWRGQWYVVHLGSVLRSGSGGEVDDPEAGPGAPTPSSTC
jgi:hypothetical protein